MIMGRFLATRKRKKWLSVGYIREKTKNDQKNWPLINENWSIIFHIGSSVISWVSKKHPIVTISSAEVAYVEATVATCQSVWLCRVLGDLLQGQEGPTPVYCDNKSTIALSKNHVFH